MGLPANCYRLGDGEDGSFVVHGSERLLSYRNLYRGYRITYDPPPIPTRACDWQYAHVDYDGPGDNRCGYAASLDDAKRDIDALYEEA